MPKNLTQDEFLSRAKIAIGDRYCLANSTYVSAKTKIDVKCYDHGCFSITPNNLLSGKGCPACARISRGVAERERTGRDFMDKCSQLSNGKYAFSKTQYRGAEFRVTVTCRIHGDFEILPHNFLKGKGCQLCGNAQRGLSNRLQQDSFIRDVQAANPMYSSCERTRYTGVGRKTYFRCEQHGEFSSKASTLLAGAGCPGCAKYGYSVLRRGSLYVLSGQNVVKVGVTNREVSQRVSAIKRNAIVPLELYKEYKFQDGTIPLAVETAILRELRATHKQPTEKFDGSTECFYDVDHEWLLSRIETLIKENTNGNS